MKFIPEVDESISLPDWYRVLLTPLDSIPSDSWHRTAEQKHLLSKAAQTLNAIRESEHDKVNRAWLAYAMAIYGLNFQKKHANLFLKNAIQNPQLPLALKGRLLVMQESLQSNYKFFTNANQSSVLTKFKIAQVNDAVSFQNYLRHILNALPYECQVYAQIKDILDSCDDADHFIGALIKLSSVVNSLQISSVKTPELVNKLNELLDVALSNQEVLTKYCTFLSHKEASYWDEMLAIKSELKKVLPSACYKSELKTKYAQLASPCEELLEAAKNLRGALKIRRFFVAINVNDESCQLDTFNFSIGSENPDCLEKYHILKFHGNGICTQAVLNEIIQDTQDIYQAITQQTAALCQVETTAFDYRGVMSSQSKPKTFDDLVADGIAQVHNILNKGYDAKKLILSGFSLGGAVAVLVAYHFLQQGIMLSLFVDRSFNQLSEIFPEFTSETFIENWNRDIRKYFAKLEPTKKLVVGIAEDKNNKDHIVPSHASLTKDQSTDTCTLLYMNQSHAELDLHQYPLRYLQDRQSGQSGQVLFVSFCVQQLLSELTNQTCMSTKLGVGK